MFFRFGAALAMVVAISLAGTALEKRNLELKRAATRQHYRLQVLEEQYLAQRVVAQQLGAPSRLMGDIDAELLAPAKPEKPKRPARPSKPKARRNSPVAGRE